MTKGEETKTGIEGLDAIFHGGIPRANMILVQGEAGTGKTLMGVEFIYQGITQYGEPGIIVVFETNPDKLIRDAASFDWNLEELQRQNKLKVIFTSPQVFEQELRSTNSLLLETAAAMGVKRIFIDGIGLLYPVPTNGHRMPPSGPGSYRELLQQL
jgi:circadian clock protein KaiC